MTVRKMIFLIFFLFYVAHAETLVHFENKFTELTTTTCRKNVIHRLSVDVSSEEMFDDTLKQNWIKNVALGLYNCHNNVNGRETGPVTATHELDEINFGIYTQFVLHTESIVNSILRDRWQNQIKMLMLSLESSAIDAKSDLDKLNNKHNQLISSSDDILKSVRFTRHELSSMLKKHKTKLENFTNTQEHLFSSIDDEMQTIGKNINETNQKIKSEINQQTNLVINKFVEMNKQSDMWYERITQERLMNEEILGFLSEQINSHMENMNKEQQNIQRTTERLADNVNAMKENWEPMLKAIELAQNESVWRKIVICTYYAFWFYLVFTIGVKYGGKHVEIYKVLLFGSVYMDIFAENKKDIEFFRMGATMFCAVDMCTNVLFSIYGWANINRKNNKRKLVA